MPKIIKAQNTLKIELYKNISMLTLLWFACFILIILLESISYLPYFGIFILSFIGLLTGYLSRKIKVCLSGINGENEAIKKIKNIPSDYTVFSNTLLTFDGKTSETDLIVVGTKGIFLIEVKNHIGIITGQENDRNWIQYKETPNGGKYTNPFYNPVKQVKTHVYRLSSILKQSTYFGWVQGVVYFPNPETEVRAKAKHIPILTHANNFSDFLERFQPKKPLTPNEQTLIINSINKQIKLQKNS